jgi:glycosyltransferase involved in cell wall biosynthesis
MNEALVITFSEWLLIAATLGGMAIIIAATWYDLRAVSFRRRLARIISTLRTPRQPSLTILIYTKNHEMSIQSCLASIHHSSYKHYSVIVIDNGSTDRTRQYVRLFKNTHPAMPLSLYAKRIVTTEAQAYRDGYLKQQQPSDLVLTIDGTMQLPLTLLKETAAHFIADPHVTTLVCHTTEPPTQSIGMLSHHWRHMSQNVFLKALSATTLLPILRSRSGRSYRSDTFLASKSIHRQGLRYASTLIIDTKTVTPLSLSSTHGIIQYLLRSLGVIMNLIFIGLTTYFFVTAAELRNHSFLSLSWLLVIVWLLNAIWSSERRPIRSKIEITLTVPFAFFIVYILSSLRILTQLGATFHSLIAKASYYLRQFAAQARLELYTTHY